MAVNWYDVLRNAPPESYQLTAICTSRVATDERNHPQQTSCWPGVTAMPLEPVATCAAAMSPAATAVIRRLAAPEWNCPVDWPTVALVSAAQVPMPPSKVARSPVRRFCAVQAARWRHCRYGSTFGQNGLAVLLASSAPSWLSSS